MDYECKTKDRHKAIFQGTSSKLNYDAIVVNCKQYNASWRYVNTLGSLIYTESDKTSIRVINDRGYAHSWYGCYKKVPSNDFNVLILSLDEFLWRFATTKKQKALKFIKDSRCF